MSIKTQQESVKLGSDVANKSGVANTSEATPEDLKERIAVLEAKVNTMTGALYAAQGEIERLRNRRDKPSGKKIVPPNTCLIGSSKGTMYILFVNPEGKFMIGDKEYKSLSAAAKAVSGVRRSGWTFWKLPNGKTAKETYVG